MLSLPGDELAMIPNHILTDLGPDDRVAVLTRAGGLLFHVHPASETRAAIAAFAAGEGAEVLATHTKDQDKIRALVESRERERRGRRVTGLWREQCDSGPYLMIPNLTW